MYIFLTSSPSTFGRRFSSGTSTSSITIWPVVEALKENFPSILGADSPFIPLKIQATIQNMIEHNFIGRCNSNSNSLVSSLEEAMDHKVVVYTRNLISKNGSHYQKQKTKWRTFIMSSKTMLCACLRLVKILLIPWKYTRIQCTWQRFSTISLV